MLDELKIRKYCEQNKFITTPNISSYQINFMMNEARKMDKLFGDFMLEVRLSNFNIVSIEELIDLYTIYVTGYSQIKS